MSNESCIFCMKSPSNTTPFCPDNPGEGCTYGMRHDYGAGEVDKPKQQPKKIDKQICVKCGVHARNPASPTNGCAHEYPNA